MKKCLLKKRILCLIRDTNIIHHTIPSIFILFITLLSPLYLQTTPAKFTYKPDIIIAEHNEQLEEDKVLLAEMKDLFFEKKDKSIKDNLVDVIRKIIPGLKNPETVQQNLVKKKAIEKYNAKPITLTTEDNINLSALYFKREKAPINLIIATGYSEHYTPTKEWGTSFAILHKHFNVLCFDWRGYGENKKKKVKFGTAAYKDVQAAIDFIKQDNDKPVVLAGFCFGAAICLYATIMAVEHKKPTANLLVLNSLYTRFENMLERAIDIEVSRIKRFLLRQKTIKNLVSNRIFSRLDGNPLYLDPISLIQKISIPCYFEHAVHDQFSPPEEGFFVYQQAPGPRVFMLSMLGSHVRIHSKIPYQYKIAFYSFLEQINFISKEEIISYL